MSAYVFTCNKTCITNTSLTGVIIIFLNTYIRRKIGGIKCLQKKRLAYRKNALPTEKNALPTEKTPCLQKPVAVNHFIIFYISLHYGMYYK